MCGKFPSAKQMAEAAEDRKWLPEDLRKELIRRCYLVFDWASEDDRDPERARAALAMADLLQGPHPILDSIQRHR